MAAALLTTASSLQCPHGGTVTIVSSNTKAKAGAALALMNDTYTIAGCSFSLPSGPHPCMKVQWLMSTKKTTVNGSPTLSQDSKGLCLAADQAPQGPVSIAQTQTFASSD